MVPERRLADGTRVRNTLGIALLALLGLAACGEGEQAGGEAPPTPPPGVTFVTAAMGETTPTESFIGRIQATDQVDLRARVTAFLEERTFEEGESVQPGDVLYRLERAPFEAEVAARQADVASAQANLKNAQLQLQRGQELLPQNNIPQAEVDVRAANRDMAQAGLLAAQAALREAEINLGYTVITSPITGRIGRTEFTKGNLVNPDSGVLATIVSQDPIYATFPVSTRVLLDVQRQGLTQQNFSAQIQLPDGSLYGQPGRLDFVGVQVDETTDTVPVRAIVPNPNDVLIDGQFVTVVIKTAQPERAIIIPQAALQTDQTGSYVLVIDQETRAQMRRVTVTRREGAQAIIGDGLAEGDRIIVSGQQRVQPGAPVSPSPQQEGPETAS